LPYFDVAHLLKKSKATLVTEIGFIDTTCPSASIYAALNQTRRKKIILGVPYRAHGLTQKKFNDIWAKTIQKPKLAFIEEFLK
jgi:cephalosporin-C deacetylase-like acetyl esterase